MPKVEPQSAIRDSIARNNPGGVVVDIANFFDGSRLGLDFFYLMCGKQLGAGISRVVYECNQNLNWVIKFEANGNTFQNVMEWEIWKAVEHRPETAKWLAECKYISDNGIVLIQERTQPLFTHQMPKMIPNWVTDASEKNWGLVDGVPKLHDYGFTHLLGNAVKAKLMKHPYHDEIEQAIMRRVPEAADK